jgi:hypothetical protein
MISIVEEAFCIGLEMRDLSGRQAVGASYEREAEGLDVAEGGLQEGELIGERGGGGIH